MKFQSRLCLLFDLPQERQKLLRPMLVRGPTDDLAGGHVERRVQICRAVALLVVRSPLELPGP